MMKIINLHATWCSPCKFFEPIFKGISEDEEYRNIDFFRYDIETDEGFELCEKYSVKSVPTTLFLDSNDNLIYRTSGVMLDNDFRDLIKNCLEKDKKA